MSASLFDEEFEELFRLNELYGRIPRTPPGSTLVVEKLLFGLRQLEDLLLQICLPYLEAGDNRLFVDADSLENTKKLAAHLHWAMSGCPETAMEVWDAVDQSVSALTIQAKATDVLLLAIAVMVVRCTIENREGPAKPITLSRSRSHPGFHARLTDACNVSCMARLFDVSDDSKLRNLAAFLRREVSAK